MVNFQAIILIFASNEESSDEDQGVESNEERLNINGKFVTNEFNWFVDLYNTKFPIDYCQNSQ